MDDFQKIYEDAQSRVASFTLALNQAMTGINKYRYLQHVNRTIPADELLAWKKSIARMGVLLQDLGSLVQSLSTAQGMLEEKEVSDAKRGSSE